MNDAASHLLAVIDDILGVLKIEAGNLSLEQSDFAFDALVREACTRVGERAAAKNIGLVVDVDERLCRVVRGAPMRVRQAILNYLDNAVKFTERGRIVVRALVAAETAADLTVRIEVQDSGVGIAPERLAQLFGSSTTRKYSGPGLGLAINQRLAALMGGEVGALSERGAGSTFWITLRVGKVVAPAAAQERAPVVPARALPAGGAARLAGRRVLVAEDNPVNQDVAVELLRAGGLIVDVAQDGVQAVEMASRQAYDLILMDVQMPKMDGLEATRAIRAAGSKVPIVAMTANAFDEDRRQCLAAGMNDHVAKPAELRVLHAALERWLPLSPAGAAYAADAAQLQSRRAALERVPGLRIATGLAYVQGRFDRYETLLRKYLVSAVNDLARLGAALADGDRHGVGAAAHSLRGAAAVVGATAVETAAHAVEAVVRTGGSDDALKVATAELQSAQETLAVAVNTIGAQAH